MAEEVIAQIKSICTQRGVEEPNIFTEFGSFTVGESGAIIYQVLDQNNKMTEKDGIWLTVLS
jgi:arginine decarboxylase